MILSGLYYQLDCNLRTTGLSVIVFIQLNYYQVYRSSNRRCFMKKGVLKDFTKFAGKQLYQSPFFNNAAGLSLHLYYKRGSSTDAFL